MKKLIFFIIFCCEISAQDKNFTISTNFDTILLGNYLEVKFTATNVDGKFIEPAFPGLTVLSGSTSFKSSTINNGEESSVSSHTYVFKPTEIGNYIIDEAKLETDNEIFKTKEKKIVVLPNPDNIIQSADKEVQYESDQLLNPNTTKVKTRKKTYKM